MTIFVWFHYGCCASVGRPFATNHAFGVCAVVVAVFFVFKFRRVLLLNDLNHLLAIHVDCPSLWICFDARIYHFPANYLYKLYFDHIFFFRSIEKNNRTNSQFFYHCPFDVYKAAGATGTSFTLQQTVIGLIWSWNIWPVQNVVYCFHRYFIKQTKNQRCIF